MRKPIYGAGLALLALMAVGVADGRSADPVAVPEKVRAETAKKWRMAYDERIKRLKEVVSGPVTTADGRRKKAIAEVELSRLKKEPFCVPPTGGPFFFHAGTAGSSPPPAALPGLTGQAGLTGPVGKAGSVGNLAEPAVRVVIAPRAGGPALVRIERESLGPQYRRLFVHDPALARSVAGQSARLTGIYYVAGHETADGKDVPVLVPIEIKPDELPPELAKSREKK